MADTVKKYISLENLDIYNQLITSKIESADAKSFKVAEIDGNTLKLYTDVPPLSDPKPTPAYSLELPYEDMTAFKTAVTTLVGDDAGKSVRTIAAEEMVRQLIPENAKESLDTLKEISEWIQSHPDDAATMNKAITELQALVGKLPEGIDQTNVVDYITALVEAEESRATSIETKLSDRITEVEAKIGSEAAFATEADIRALFS